MDSYLDDLSKWMSLKGDIHFKDTRILFNKREIWWASIGKNIGSEQNGKHERVERPILILKEFNQEVLWMLLITSTKKDGQYYYSFNSEDKKESTVILSQLRLISSKRLIRKVGMLEESKFEEIRKRIKDLI